jgi:hypothetical protein
MQLTSVLEGNIYDIIKLKIQIYIRVMFKEIFSYLHIICPFIISTYLFWRADTFDIFYVYYFITLNISWLLFKDECLISYIYKKINDPSYVLGASTNVDDFEYILGKNISDKMINYYIPFMYVLNFLVIIYLGKLENSVKIFMLLSVISYCIYIYSLKSNMNLNSRQFIKNIHTVIITVFLGTTLHSHMKKLKKFT